MSKAVLSRIFGIGFSMLIVIHETLAYANKNNNSPKASIIFRLK